MRRLMFVVLFAVVGCGPAVTTAPAPNVAAQPRPAADKPTKTPDAPKAQPTKLPPQNENAIVIYRSNFLDPYNEYQNPINADAKYLDKLVSIDTNAPDKVWKDGDKYYLGVRWQLVGRLGEPLSQDADCLSYVWELSADGAKQFAALPAGATLTIIGRCKGSRPARGTGDLNHQVFFVDSVVKAAAKQ